MGCLKKLTSAIVITLAIIGFISIGGKDFISGVIHNYFNPPQDKLLQRAQKIGDFSRINEEFEIEKAAGIMGYNTVIAEHKSTGQKMVVVDTGVKHIITKEDLTSSDVEDRLKNSLKNIKYSPASLEKFNITGRGTIYSYEQNAPYVKFEARIKKMPIGDISGMICVVKDSKGNDKILISAAEKSKYSQLISNEFFKAVK